jgi:hypothetical protein
MKTFLNTALALAAASSLGFAGTGSDADKWSGLDQEINNLAATLGQGGGPSVGALIRSALFYSDDDAFISGTGDDLIGLSFQDAILWSQGNLGDYFWRISLNAADGERTLFDGAPDSGFEAPENDVHVEDAYARWMVSDTFYVTWGNFIAPVTRSSTLGDENLLFIGRSEITHTFRVWDPGAMIGGTAGNFVWDIAAQNGADSTDEDFVLSARGQFNWNQGVGAVEGASGAADGTNGAIGVFYVDVGDIDGTNTADETIIGVDALVTIGGGFSVGGEMADFDTADATPWNVVASFLFQPEWEAALRYGERDNIDDETTIELGLNFYQSGHNAKWQLNFGDISSDNNANEGSIIALGLSVGASS